MTIQKQINLHFIQIPILFLCYSFLHLICIPFRIIQGTQIFIVLIYQQQILIKIIQMIKANLTLLLTVVLFSQLTQTLTLHQQTATATNNHNTTVNTTTFDSQFSKIYAEFDSINKQVTIQNQSQYAGLITKLSKYQSDIQQLERTLKDQKTQIVLGVEQCPPNTTNEVKIKSSVHKLEESATATEVYMKNCTDCTFAKKHVDAIEKFTKDYSIFVNRTLDKGFCTTARSPTITASQTTQNNSTAPSNQTKIQNKTQSIPNKTTPQNKTQTANNQTKPENNTKTTTKTATTNNTHNNTNTTQGTVALNTKVIATKPNCASGQIYDSFQKLCVKIRKFCHTGEVYVRKIKQCVPISRLCFADQYYNTEKQACYAKSLQCQADQRYDRKKHQCVKITTQCPANYTFHVKLRKCVKNLVCKEGEVINEKYMICEKVKIKCPGNQQFDYTTKKCVTHDYITSPYYTNLTYSGNFKNYVKYYATAKKTDKALKDCPQNTPFYQKSIKMCITCPESTPYFDLTLDYCIKCKYNELFNPYRHKCVNEKKVFSAPRSVSRMKI